MAGCIYTYKGIEYSEKEFKELLMSGELDKFLPTEMLDEMPIKKIETKQPVNPVVEKPKTALEKLKEKKYDTSKKQQTPGKGPNKSSAESGDSAGNGKEEKIKILKKRAKATIKSPLYLKALDVESQDPRTQALQYFISGGRIHRQALEKLFGGNKVSGKKNVEGEIRAHFQLQGKHGPRTTERLGEDLWDASPQEIQNKYDSQDFINAVEDVLLNHSSRTSMAEELIDHTPEEDEWQKYYDQTHENLDEEQQNEVDRTINILELEKSGYRTGQYGGNKSDTYYINDKNGKTVKEIKFTDSHEGHREAYKWIDEKAGTNILEKYDYLHNTEFEPEQITAAEEVDNARFEMNYIGDEQYKANLETNLKQIEGKKGQEEYAQRLRELIDYIENNEDTYDRINQKRERIGRIQPTKQMYADLNKIANEEHRQIAHDFYKAIENIVDYTQNSLTWMAASSAEIEVDTLVTGKFPNGTKLTNKQREEAAEQIQLKTDVLNDYVAENLQQTLDLQEQRKKDVEIAKKLSELEQQKQAKINEATKPVIAPQEVKIEIEDLANTTEANRQQHNDIVQKLYSLKELVNCLWA